MTLPDIWVSQFIGNDNIKNQIKHYYKTLLLQRPHPPLLAESDARLGIKEQGHISHETSVKRNPTRRLPKDSPLFRQHGRANAVTEHMKKLDRLCGASNASLSFYSIKTKSTKVCDDTLRIFICGLITAMPPNTWYSSHLEDKLIRKCFHATKVNITIFPSRSMFYRMNPK